MHTRHLSIAALPVALFTASADAQFDCSAGGDCFHANGTPGCFDETCCQTVCAALPFCCVIEWDASCASVAVELCEPCASDCNDNGISDCDESKPDCNDNGIFDVCDIVDGTSEDHNGDGIPDECQDCNGNGVADDLDIANGTSEDCNCNGIPDECELCSMDVVFILDTSQSMDEDLPIACTDLIGTVDSQLAALVPGTYRSTVLGISNLEACATGTVIGTFGATVPGDPGACGPMMCTGGHPGQGCEENWGQATAVVAQGHGWVQGALRVIIPVGDEGPCEGDVCEDPGPDRDAIDNAIAIAVQNDVRVYPVMGIGSQTCIVTLSEDLAGDTGGRAFLAIENDDPSQHGGGIPYADIAVDLTAALAALVANCSDLDADGIPDGCLCPWDLDGDSTVGILDLLELLGTWGSCPGCPGDFVGCDDVVGINEFLALLAFWGPCPTPPDPPGICDPGYVPGPGDPSPRTYCDDDYRDALVVLNQFLGVYLPHGADDNVFCAALTALGQPGRCDALDENTYWEVSHTGDVTITVFLEDGGPNLHLRFAPEYHPFGDPWAPANMLQQPGEGPLDLMAWLGSAGGGGGAATGVGACDDELKLFGDPDDPVLGWSADRTKAILASASQIADWLDFANNVRKSVCTVTNPCFVYGMLDAYVEILDDPVGCLLGVNCIATLGTNGFQFTSVTGLVRVFFYYGSLWACDLLHPFGESCVVEHCSQLRSLILLRKQLLGDFIFANDGIDCEDLSGFHCP